MATHSSILAWKIPWTEEPGRLQSLESPTEWDMTEATQHTCTHYNRKCDMLSMKQKQTHSHKEQTCGCQGGEEVGEGWTGSLKLVDADYYIQIG